MCFCALFLRYILSFLPALMLHRTLADCLFCWAQKARVNQVSVCLWWLLLCSALSVQPCRWMARPVGGRYWCVILSEAVCLRPVRLWIQLLR